MKLLTSRGPRIDPCGTPLDTFLQFDEEPLMNTIWVWFSSQLWIHVIDMLSNPYLTSFLISFPEINIFNVI